VANKDAGGVAVMAAAIKRTFTGESQDTLERADSNVSVQKAQTHNLPLHVTVAFTILIPCIVGAINFCMVALDLQLVTFKYKTMETLTANSGSALVGGGALAGICALYAMCSAGLVLFVDPKSAGSGIPESKGYMNGNAMPGFFTMKGLIVRAIGVVFTVGAGFPVGREGPMVSIGGCVGFAVVSLLATPHVRKWVKLDTDEEEGGLNAALVTDEGRFSYALRIGCSLGSSAGIATAFNAPIGGILYMFEEVTVTNWAPETTFKAFIGSVLACLISGSLMQLLGSAAHSLLIFDPDSDPTAQKFSPIDWIFVALSAALIGALSSVFAKCLAGVWAWRKRVATRLAKSGPAVANTVKLLEAMSYAALVALVFSLIPSIISCDPSPSHGSSHGSSQSTSASMGSSHGRRLSGLYFHPYDCDDGEQNPIASLLLTGAEGAVKHLFDQTESSYISPVHLVITFVAYFIMACGMPGLQVPMGCFVPSMLLGALSGRFLGQLFQMLGLGLAAPGVYSMAGAAAFLGGFTHMTLAITALLVEAARDLSLIPMLMLAISISHVVSTSISHHGYDEVLIMKKGVPYLEAELPHELEHGQTAIDLMDEYDDDAILPFEGGMETVEQALAHDVDVFPVVDDEGVCLGTVERLRLQAAVNAHKPVATCQKSETEVSAVIQQMARRPSLTRDGIRIPIHRLMDRCPHTILEDMPVPRFYSMFSLGSVQYAAVVSKQGEFRGVLTRRNLISASSHSHAKEIPMKRMSESPRKSRSASPRRSRSASPHSSACVRKDPVLLGCTQAPKVIVDMERENDSI